ncbi:hypothetical protein [Nocardia sp. CC227C]|uniref:hypothetical protein n=1 Tax=Nocardia sp. CC227C TaxID=3044562 RepID=UPI00278C4B68|nr:hypothetical protein [Nocardia sp. CC227C]
MSRLKSAASAAAIVAVLATGGTAFALNSTPQPTSTDSPRMGKDATLHTLRTPVVDRVAGDRAAAALHGTGLEIPVGWNVADVRAERHDDRDVTVVRYQPDGYRLGGEHADVVLDADGTIVGFTRLALSADTELPDNSASEEIARDFLHRTAPDYLAGLTVQWVDRHEENLTLPDGTIATVAGTKVKMRHDNGRYAWVIVGPEGAVQTFERDITWDSGQGRRSTEMWMHDAWIAAHDGAGPQPEAPYALVS